MRGSDRAFLVLGLALFAAALLLPGPAPPAPPRAAIVVEPFSLPTEVRTASLGSGETLGALLPRLGVESTELPRWLTAARSVLDLRSLPVGLAAEAELDFHGIPVTVRLNPDWRASVVLERTESGIAARREPRPVERELAVVQGSVSSSLFEAVAGTGEQDELAIALADLFQWDIDFHREVRSGDTFSLLVERVASEGRTVAYGPIVAAEYVNAGKSFRAYRFSHGGQVGYYDAAGRPLRKQFLRAPLRVSRITSRFSKSRLHPVLGRRLPHWGVDYGAPTGTPVMATASGTVSHAGWRGGGGKTVEVRHAGGWRTAYLHLSRFASGIRVGARVEQGQVIGYVGSTGLSTGSHLDYRVTRNGSYVNPLSIGSEPAPPLPARDLAAFEKWTAVVGPWLSRPGALDETREAAVRAEPGLGAGG